MSCHYDILAALDTRRRDSTGSSISSSSSTSSTPPPLPTLAECFLGQWSPEFAAKYIYPVLNERASSRTSLCSPTMDEPMVFNPPSPRPLRSSPQSQATTSCKSTDQLVLSASEFPTRENRYCVSNYTLEKIALYSLRHGGDVSGIIDQFVCYLPAESKAGFISKIHARMAKLMEKRRQLPLCGFCRNNGKPPHCYLSHTTRDVNGKVSCPILLNYRCPRCGATGADAHTTSYCPLNTAK